MEQPDYLVLIDAIPLCYSVLIKYFIQVGKVNMETN
jgi:hypothetical protein